MFKFNLSGGCLAIYLASRLLYCYTRQPTNQPTGERCRVVMLQLHCPQVFYRHWQCPPQPHVGAGAVIPASALHAPRFAMHARIQNPRNAAEHNPQGCNSKHPSLLLVVLLKHINSQTHGQNVPWSKNISVLENHHDAHAFSPLPRARASLQLALPWLFPCHHTLCTNGCSE